jgi:hypothetical protein
MRSGQEIDRRTFMKIGTTALTANLVPALEAEAKSPVETPYPVKWYPFSRNLIRILVGHFQSGRTGGSMRRLAPRAYRGV